MIDGKVNQGRGVLPHIVLEAAIRFGLKLESSIKLLQSLIGDFSKEVGLVGEMVVERARRHASRRGDIVAGHAVETSFGEEGFTGRDESFACPCPTGRESGGRRRVGGGDIHVRNDINVRLRRRQPGMGFRFVSAASGLSCAGDK